MADTELRNRQYTCKECGKVQPVIKMMLLYSMAMVIERSLCPKCDKNNKDKEIGK